MVTIGASSFTLLLIVQMMAATGRLAVFVTSMRAQVKNLASITLTPSLKMDTTSRFIALEIKLLCGFIFCFFKVLSVVVIILSHLISG